LERSHWKSQTNFTASNMWKKAVENSKSENLYALCDLGLSITKELVQDLVPSLDCSMPISPPTVLYKSLEESKEIDI